MASAVGVALRLFGHGTPSAAAIAIYGCIQGGLQSAYGGHLSACTPAGVYLFNTFLRKVELRRLFFNLTLIGVAAGFTQLLLVTGELLRHVTVIMCTLTPVR